MEPPGPTALSDLASELDDAFASAAGGGPEQVIASAERLAASVPVLTAWRDQVRAGKATTQGTIADLEQLQEKTFRLAKIIRHTQWVQQTLTDIANDASNVYGHDGRPRSEETGRLIVDG